MEVLFRKLPPTMVAIAVAVCVLGMMVPEVSGTRWTVGSSMGWTTGVNYTIWAQDKQFYNGNWLWCGKFLEMNVLEVNKADYDACNSANPIHSLTTGAGRDVIPLNLTRPYYFISGNGFCYGGMKLAINVENLPPPPSSLPLDQKNSAPTLTFRWTRLVLPVALAV